MFKSVAAFLANKIKWLGLLLFSAGAQFMAPLWVFIAGVSVLVVIDRFTGVAAARRRGEPITSRGYARTAEKAGIWSAYIIATEVVRVISQAPEWANFTYLTVMAILSTELKSIAENTGNATGTNILGWLTSHLPTIGDVLPKKKFQENEQKKNPPQG